MLGMNGEAVIEKPGARRLNRFPGGNLISDLWLVS
jgi:hypothetical protein